MDRKPSPEKNNDLDDLTVSVKDQSQYDVFSNLDQSVIVTTEDRLNLLLRNHLGSLESKNSWGTPLGIVLTIGLTLLTADFKEDLIFSKDFLAAVFFLLGVASGVWLIRSIVIAYKSREITIETLIGKIKRIEDAPNQKSKNNGGSN